MTSEEIDRIVAKIQSALEEVTAPEPKPIKVSKNRPSEYIHSEATPDMSEVEGQIVQCKREDYEACGGLAFTIVRRNVERLLTRRDVPIYDKDYVWDRIWEAYAISWDIFRRLGLNKELKDRAKIACCTAARRVAYHNRKLVSTVDNRIHDEMMQYAELGLHRLGDAFLERRSPKSFEPDPETLLFIGMLPKNLRDVAEVAVLGEPMFVYDKHTIFNPVPESKRRKVESSQIYAGTGPASVKYISQQLGLSSGGVRHRLIALKEYIQSCRGLSIVDDLFYRYQNKRMFRETRDPVLYSTPPKGYPTYNLGRQHAIYRRASVAPKAYQLLDLAIVRPSPEPVYPPEFPDTTGTSLWAGNLRPGTGVMRRQSVRTVYKPICESLWAALELPRPEVTLRMLPAFENVPGWRFQALGGRLRYRRLADGTRRLPSAKKSGWKMRLSDGRIQLSKLGGCE